MLPWKNNPSTKKRMHRLIGRRTTAAPCAHPTQASPSTQHKSEHTNKNLQRNNLPCLLAKILYKEIYEQLLTALLFFLGTHHNAILGKYVSLQPSA
jgi:hypothetical protein